VIRRVLPRLRARLRLCVRSNFDAESLRVFGLCVPPMDVAIVAMVTFDAIVAMDNTTSSFGSAVVGMFVSL